MNIVNNLIQVERIVVASSDIVKYTIDDFDFGTVLVCTNDSRGSSHLVTFRNFKENFFYYGYGIYAPTRCNLSVDSSKKEISVYVAGQYNQDNVSNLIMWSNLCLYKFSK